MKLSAKQKKWLKILLILICIRLVVGGVFNYIIEYRVKDIVQIIVNKESKGLYAFDASTVKFSLLKKNVIVENAVLHCNDTLHTTPHYDLKIDKVYLSLASWKELIFNQRLLVDSLSIDLPRLNTHAHEQNKEKQLSFHASQIFSFLQKTMMRLQVRSFTLNNGSFAYSNKHSLMPFISNRINLTVKNFSKKDNQSNQLFGSDDVDLSLTNQHWTLPDGLHKISFRQLHFSGKNQLFELDSCSFHAEATETKPGMSLSAFKVFFNSSHLSATYEKEELLIDTLIFIRPVLSLQTSGTKKQTGDSAAISQTVQQLFKGMHFKYIDIDNGQVILTDKSTSRPIYATQQTDLRIYNLRINPDSQTRVATDSIQLNLRSIRFTTADSLFELNIAEFELRNNDVVFKNAVFGPTSQNRSVKNLVFKTPYLRLKHINLEDLLKQKLNASEAELHNPTISIYAKAKTGNQGRNSTKARGIGDLYRTLHDLHELIAVHDFNIINGNVHYQSAGASPIDIEMKNISTDILLDRFLTSDSLIDIKRSMPKLTVQEITARSPKLNLHLNNYTFTGFNRHNHLDDAELTLDNGSTLKGKQLYWEILDWDLLAQRKIIQIQELKINQLTININKQNPDKQQVPHDLPVLRIGRIDINELKYNMQSAGKENVSFVAQDLCVDSISSQKRFLIWNTAIGQLNNIVFNNKNTHALINTLDLDNEHETVLKGSAIDMNSDQGYTKLRVPELKLNASLHSSDFSSLDIKSLAVENPEIDIQTHAGQKNKAKPFSMPLNLDANKLIVKNATVHYTTISEKDTSSLTTGISLRASSLHTYKNQEKLFHYDQIAIDLSDLQFNKHLLSLAVPQSSIVLTKGNVASNPETGVSLNTAVLFKWSGTRLKTQKPGISELAIENLAGNFENENFSLGKGKPLSMQSFINNTGISEGKLHFWNNSVTADAHSFSWNPRQNKLSIRSFSLMPNLSMEESFKKAEWQADYMTVKGESVDLSGIQFNRNKNDSSLVIQKIMLQQVVLTTARDKLKPFKHGIEKLMPTKLINTIKYPLQIDSLVLNQGSITVMENSLITHKHGTIPLEHLNAVITNIRNRNNENDSLDIVANAQLFNNYIRHFHYKEAYGDSLSSFTVNLNASSMLLPEYSQVTAPLAAVSVNRGNADTLFARWVGNKYAAIGVMNFYYDGLKVQLLDKRNPDKKGFLLSLANMLANAIIVNKKNSKYSRVYFERDREKFVFNYWVKTSLRGLLSSIGIKSNKKYYKQYLKVRDQYSLPQNVD